MISLVFWLTHPCVGGWNLNESQLGKIKKELPDADTTICRDKAEFLAALPEADVAVSWYFKEEWLALAPHLKKLVTPAAGKDLLGVRSTSSVQVEFSSFHGEIMAETVVGMLLCQARGIIKAYSLQTSLPWPQPELAGMMRVLKGSRVTVWGFGHIGRHIARLAKAFGVKLYGVKRDRIPPPSYFEKEDRILTLAELDAVLPETDHLVLCLPAETETDNLLDARRLSLLPGHAAVYNVGRGNVLDETALVEALESGRLAAAYLDVFRQEPLPPDSPLRTCRNCYLMPHASAIAPHYLDLFLDEFLIKCKEWFKKDQNR